MKSVRNLLLLRKHIALSLFAVIATLCIASWAQKNKPLPPPPPPADPAIVYVAERAWSTTDLMVMNADGTNKTVLIAGGTGPTSNGYHDPVWSADGNRIAFCFNHDIPSSHGVYMINKDGTGLCKVIDTAESCTYGAVHPQWSPDGTKILYSDTEAQPNEDLYVVDAVCGANPASKVNITNTPEIPEFFPAWSSDGTKVVIVHGNPNGGYYLSLYAVSADWQQATFITNLNESGPLKNASAPYTNWAQSPNMLAVSSGDIWTVDVSNPFGPVFTNITKTTGIIEIGPGWSPGDAQFVYVRDGNIWVMDANGANPKQIASSGQKRTILNEPDWRPVK